MGWITKLFGAASREETDGIRLDASEPHWELDGPDTFVELFNALHDWLPEDATLYFESGSPHSEIHDFLRSYSVPERAHVAVGGWPRPKVFHVPASATALEELSRIMEHHAEPELAIHFHVYRNGSVVLEWHDAFSQPMLLSGDIPDEHIKVLAGKIGKKFRKIGEQ